MSIDRFNLLSQESFINQQNTENILLASIVQKKIANETTDFTPNSWENVDSMVDLGLAKTSIYIGDQFVSTRNNVNITWDVIGHNCETLSDTKYSNRDNMTLYMHDLFSESLVQFGARQAFYVTDNGLTAGVYNILIESQPWYTRDQGKYAQFELTQDLPAGGQIVFTHADNTTMFGKTLSTLASPESTTALENIEISEGTEGINLGTLKASLQNSINSSYRAFWGSGNYKESAVRQWLNSKNTAGNVWNPQTKFDRPPSWADTLNGFMYGMDEDFLKVIKKTHIKYARNTLFEGGGYDEIDDYFYLLSKPQIYGGATVLGVDEGEIYPYFINYSTLNAAGTGNDKNRIKTRNGSAQWYWLRSPGAGYGSNVWNVAATGQLYHNSASYAGGVAAACTI